MGHRQWGLVAVLAVVAACGGTVSNSNGAAGSAGTAPGASAEAGNGAAGTAPGASAEAGRAGVASTDPACRFELSDLKGMDVECPAELCAATVLASGCDALPAGVVKTSRAGCDGMLDATGDGRMRTVTFELSATRRKACYYEAKYDAPAQLVGARVWEDTAIFCDGTASQISAGVVPSAACAERFSNTLCDLADPTQSAPASPAVPACYGNGSATCGPCCDPTPPDCTGKPESYGGCSPVGNAYCSCDCEQQQWTCLC
ncbi:MAG TPA: hypothetical protein VIK01_02660 [Polyangiaceae bacterium]